MGCQKLTGGEHSQTNWTLRMERYFIDLLLDQVHGCNRMGHTFNKQAWTDMLLVFNSKFGCQYDKDILKSRYTNLWKRYNDIKNIIGQSQFSWDASQKMVIADDFVWDAYIKVHPEAQSYKNKVLTDFNDLCLIYAHTSADGRYSRSSHDINSDDDIQGVKEVGVEMGNLAPTIQERTKKEWIPAMDQYFIELMLDQQRKGIKVDMTFRKQDWTDMLTFFNLKFCSNYDQSFLKHRYKKLLKYYTDATSLLEQIGLSLDVKQKMIVADDHIWDKYTKAHPDAWSYRKKSLLNFQTLGLIFGAAITNGSKSHLQKDIVFQDKILQIKAGEKVSQSSAGNQSGSLWLPQMDHYFVDLLLDQVLKGNKIGHAFITQAWTEVISLFNAKFRSHHDKDDMKNRSKHLRRQYCYIKNLLEQKGFSWDDSQEMVTAGDYVWDSYSKVDPDALLYRNRSVPSYHKLCVIYGQESSNGTWSPSVFNEELESDGPEFEIEEEGIECHANSDCSRSDWTSSMDRYLLDLMLEQVHKGYSINFNSSDQVWADIIISFGDRFGFQHDKHVLSSQHKSLGKQYDDMKNLLNQTGFSWDETRQMITAYDDEWDAYIEDHPYAKSYRSRAKLNYNDLCLIYGNPTFDDGGNRDYGSRDDGTRLDGRHHWRTNWTPLMDRYFIDLMLEQTRLGCMTDDKFNKQAWSDMIAKFNAEFGSRHNKAILESRFVDLKNLFKDMKNLLSENGFSWDEMRQMLTADDDIWNAYVQAHPDARLYRHRRLPNYNDLFLIYGTATSYNGSNRCMDAEDYDSGDDIGEENEQFFSSNLPRMCWTKPMDNYFTNLMLEQVQRGNRIDQTFTEQAWDWMTTSLNGKFGLTCDRLFLKNQHLRLMGEYKGITALLNQRGFEWDETNQTITAEDEVWDAYVEEYPDAIKYRFRILDNYYDLYRIYGERIPEGKKGRITVKLKVKEDSSGMEIADTSAASDERKKRKLGTLSTVSFSRNGQKSRKAIQYGIKESSSIESVVDALQQTVQEMDDELFLEACQLLEDERAAKMFVAMNVTARRNWLLKKLCR